MSFLFGIDGGGTGCRAILADLAGNPLGRGRSGPSNIMTDFELARANITDAAEAAAHNAGLGPEVLAQSAAFLGLAGANIGDYADRFASALPFGRSHIDTDALISLEGAVGSGDGVVAIVGTGSVFATRLGENVKSVGGWGFKLGDQASGARLGHMLFRQALQAHDGVCKNTGVTRQLLAEFGDDPQKLVDFSEAAKPRDFARYAPRIFEAATGRDAAAMEIVNGAVDDLTEIFDAIVVSQTQKLCLLGGLSAIYTSLLPPKYRDRVSAPKGDAVEGAVGLAVQHFGQVAVGKNA